MDTKLLGYFIAVAENLNFTEAAKKLYITQSALSRNIAELEKELGTKLFVRTTRSVMLTPSGKAFYEVAREIEDKLNQVYRRIDKYNSGLFGDLRIGHLLSPFIDVLPPLFLAFRQKFPEIELTCTQYNTGSLCKTLERGAIDIGFASSFNFHDSNIYKVHIVKPDSICLVFRKDHPACRQPHLDFNALAQEPFVILAEQESPIFFNLFKQVCKNRGFVPHLIDLPQRPESILFYVMAGFGIGVITTCMINNSGAYDLEYREIEGKDASFFNVAAYKKDNLNPSIPVFIRELELIGNNNP